MEYNDPFILAPSAAPSAPPCESFPTPAAKASKEAQDYKRKVDAYNAALDDYNRKIRTYNSCMTQVREIRRAEESAHEQFVRSISKLVEVTEKNPGNGANYAFVALSRANSVLGLFEGKRDEAERWSNKFKAIRTIYQQYGQGMKFDHNLLQVLAKYKGWYKAHGVAAERLEKYKSVSDAVKPFTKASAAHPLRGEVVTLAEHSKTAIKGVPAGVLKRIGWVGSTLTVGSNVYDYLEGKQTFAETSLRSGGELGGAAVGGAVTGAAGGAIFGPWGAAIGGLGGAATGALEGDDLVDQYMKSHNEEMDSLENWQPLQQRSPMKHNY